MTDEETILILNKMMNIDNVFILREIKRKQALQQAIENTKELQKIKKEIKELKQRTIRV